MVVSLRRRLLPALFLVLSCVPALAGPVRAFGQTADDQLRQDYLRLKNRFEALAGRNSDPEILACLAVETTALVWTLAAAHLADDPEDQDRWQREADAFEKSWSESRRWDNRHQRALKAYYQALSEVTRLLLSAGPDQRLEAEFQVATDHTGRKLAALAEKPDAALEREALSGGLVGAAYVLVRILGRGTLDHQAGLIIADMAEEAAAVRRRRGLHYRARLAFLNACNVQGLTDLIFLLRLTTVPTLGRNLDQVHAVLKKPGPDHRLSTLLGLTWVAQAQAALPLTYWLINRPRPDQGGAP